MPGETDTPVRKKPVIVSIHDAMPATFANVLEIVKLLKSLSVHPVTILVVPGMNWHPADITRLKNLQEHSGIQLAGHGWRHRADRFGTLSHRVHGLLISRNEAEHLSLGPCETAELIDRNYNWFSGVGLKPPELYVPPAWAMGKLDRKVLSTLPYRYFETLFGIYDSHRDKLHPMALCGYMADSAIRSFFLRISNALNKRVASLPLRIAIHPNDLSLPLAADLKALLQQKLSFSFRGLPLSNRSQPSLFPGHSFNSSREGEKEK